MGSVLRAKPSTRTAGWAGPRTDPRVEEAPGRHAGRREGTGVVPPPKDLHKRTKVPFCPFHPLSEDPGPARACEFIETRHL